MRHLVFLGGTCGNNDWREHVVAALVARGVPAEALHNPVVKDWTPEAQAREEEVKRAATLHVYYIADPKLPGNPVSFFSGVEAAMALYDRPGAVVIAFDAEGMAGHLARGMKRAADVLRERFPGAAIFDNKAEMVDWLAARLVPASAAQAATTEGP